MILLLLCLFNAASGTQKGKADKFACRGTLIILPTSKQIETWKEIMNKYGIFNKYRVCIVESKNEHRVLTYKQIASSDFLLISAKFLRSQDYKEFYYKELVPKSMHRMSHSQDDDDDDKMAEFEDEMGPNLRYLCFQRMILYSPEQFMHHKANRDVLMDIESTFGWYAPTGSFLKNRKAVTHLLDFIEIHIQFPSGIEFMESNKILNTPLGYLIHKILKNYLFAKLQ